MSKGDWRRDNVNHMIESTNQIIKEIKPWVTFGVAPFGIWRPGNPPGIVGMDAYEALYCDSKKWINEGWLDYIAPQLYVREFSIKYFLKYKSGLLIQPVNHSNLCSIGGSNKTIRTVTLCLVFMHLV